MKVSRLFYTIRTLFLQCEKCYNMYRFREFGYCTKTILDIGGKIYESTCHTGYSSENLDI